MSLRVLAINPGSTTTKIAVFWGKDEVLAVTIRHPSSELSQFAHIMDQEAYRRAHIVDVLQKIT